jgi:hypothetical protein
MSVTRWGYEVLCKEVEAGRKTGLPVNMHFGQMWALPLETGACSDSVVSDNEDTEAPAP